MSTEPTSEEITNAMAAWLVEHIDPDSIGVARISDPIGANVYFTARTVARLLTGQMNTDLEKIGWADDVVNGKLRGKS